MSKSFKPIDQSTGRTPYAIALKEAAVALSLSGAHPCFATLVDICMGDMARLSFAWPVGFQLVTTMVPKDGWNPSEVLLLMSGLVAAMKTLHAKAIVHLNIESNSVGASSTRSEFKLLQYSGCSVRSSSAWVAGHLSYRSPEILLGVREPTPAADIWSVGVLVAFVCLGTPFFDSSLDEMQAMRHIIALFGSPTCVDVAGLCSYPRWNSELHTKTAAPLDWTSLIVPKMGYRFGDTLKNMLQYVSERCLWCIRL